MDSQMVELFWLWRKADISIMLSQHRGLGHSGASSGLSQSLSLSTSPLTMTPKKNADFENLRETESVHV